MGGFSIFRSYCIYYLPIYLILCFISRSSPIAPCTPVAGILPIGRWRAYRKTHGKWPATVDTEILSREERIEWKIQNGVSAEDAEEEEKEIAREKKEKVDGEGDVDRDTRDGLDIGKFYTCQQSTVTQRYTSFT